MDILTMTAAYKKSLAAINRMLHSGSTTLDATLIAGKEYHLGTINSLELSLPTTGDYQDYIKVIFVADTSFTPTSTGGSIVRDALTETVANKTYEYLFTWNGTAWALQSANY